MVDDINITDHITHTNNTLIFGRLNRNENVPSLVRSIVNNNTEEVIESIYNGDDSERLAVKDIGDVTRIFKPTYFFSVGERSVDGAMKKVAKHTLERREDGLPVEITQDSLCFRILDSQGRLKIDDIIKTIRTHLSKARDHYIKAAKSRHPVRIKDQEKMRHDLVSQLMEPVVLYMIAAESATNYSIFEQDQEKANASEIGKFIEVVEPVFEDGDYRLKKTKIKITKDEIFSVSESEDVGDMISNISLLRNDIRMGRQYLAAAVSGQLKSFPDESALTEDRKLLVESLVRSGIASELMIDDLKEEASACKLLTGNLDKYVSEKPRLLLIMAEKSKVSIDEDKMPEAESDSETGSIPKKRALASLELSQKLRDDLEKKDLNKNIKRVETFALTYYKDDAEKQIRISNYLQTLTTVGQIKNKFSEMEKRYGGRKDLLSEPGIEVYLELCLEEGAERSNLVSKFKDQLLHALLLKEYKIKSENKDDFEKFHDELLHVAKTVFEDYIATVSPVVSQLMGIQRFLKITSETVERKPRVLIANADVGEIMEDDRDKSNFSNFISDLDDVNREGFERAISIAVVPKLEDIYKNEFFAICYKFGIATFFSSEEPIEFNNLNDPNKLKELKVMWSSKGSLDHSCGVLCVPDTVLLAGGFTFKLGEEIVGKRTVTFELEGPIVEPICYTAAALVARNDDAKYVDSFLALQGKKLHIKLEWPCIGMSFEKETMPLWETEALSNGVILEKNLEEELPLCIFEHSKDAQGRLNKQRVRYVNSLYMIDDLTIPITGYRIAMYLSRVLKRNYKNGINDGKLEYFCTRGKLGIYQDGVFNSILDDKRYLLNFQEKNRSIDLLYRGQNQAVGRFPVVLQKSNGEGKIV